VILLPNISAERQQRLFEAAIQSIEAESPTNEVIEVHEISEGNFIRIVVERHILPALAWETGQV
jgi:hypothetical protein